MNFGELLSDHRKAGGLTLREFSKLVGYDSSNISKIERGILTPPQSTITLRNWAKALGLDQASKETAVFIASGMAARVKRHVKTDSELDALMPAFFRAVNNKRVDPETYKKLKALLRDNL